MVERGWLWANSCLIQKLLLHNDPNASSTSIGVAPRSNSAFASGPELPTRKFVSFSLHMSPRAGFILPSLLSRRISSFGQEAVLELSLD